MARLQISGLLIDVDGVLRVDDEPIPGAIQSVAELRRMGFPLRFLTNTSVRSRASLHRNLAAIGLPIPEGELFTAPVATAAYLRETGKRRIYLLVKGDVVDEFRDFEIVGDGEPGGVDAVVVGGAEENFTYERINRAFQLVHGGAALVAIHRNGSWQTARGLQIDAGAYVAGLEYATGTSATVIGKPSPAFFQLALEDLGIAAADALVVGDDAQADIVGGQRLGAQTALVRTGKFREADLSRLSIAPDLVLGSIAELPVNVKRKA
jgi:HAD superfamily hydrolase (TIGR01458 family)